MEPRLAEAAALGLSTAVIPAGGRPVASRAIRLRAVSTVSGALELLSDA
jgi:predicted ATP-dependent serine protease